MEIDQLQEKFDTGLKKIGIEIRSRLGPHGLFGTIGSGVAGDIPDGTRVEIHAKGRTVGRSFGRAQIEGCHLRVGGAVLSEVTAMVDELAAHSKCEAVEG